ncbi:MAG: hypothetical protein V3V99_02455 [candidate division Zixibacteria bacterium]
MMEPIVVSIAGVVISALIALLISSFRIGIYKNKVDNACDDLKEVKTELREVRDMAVSCTTSLKEREPLVSRGSPIDLSDRGKIVLADSGGKKFIDENFEEFKSKLEMTHPETAYDVQEAAKLVIEGIKDDKRLNFIKDYLFREGMAIEDMIIVLGIYLRNKVLEEKGLDFNEIDKKVV